MLRILLSHPLVYVYLVVVSAMLFAALVPSKAREQRVKELSQLRSTGENVQLVQAWTGPCPNHACLRPLENLRRRGGGADRVRLAAGAPGYAAMFKEAVTRIVSLDPWHPDG